MHSYIFMRNLPRKPVIYIYIFLIKLVFSVFIGIYIKTNIAKQFTQKLSEITLQKLFAHYKLIFSFHSKKVCISTIKIDRVRVNLYIPYFRSKRSNGRNLSNPSNLVYFVLIVFADHENIGKNPKFMFLLCTVQKLWLF